MRGSTAPAVDLPTKLNDMNQETALKVKRIGDEIYTLQSDINSLKKAEKYGIQEAQIKLFQRSFMIIFENKRLLMWIIKKEIENKQNRISELEVELAAISQPQKESPD